PPQFQNSGGAELTGAGLELEYSFSPLYKLDTNISYAKSKFDATGDELPGAANWLSNIGLFYEPKEDILVNLQYRYVGERGRDVGDTRSDLDGYQTVDVTCSLFNLWSRDLTLRAGIKNIFDEDVRFVSSMNTYPEDLPRPGTSYWLQISYDY
ncbi:MAG: TonB-dependent receptor, partial [Gammaproteobacteria bacterium]|nr:TonB-dependent receptor [Gammaproteobacteria bacterium]